MDKSIERDRDRERKREREKYERMSFRVYSCVVIDVLPYNSRPAFTEKRKYKLKSIYEYIHTYIHTYININIYIYIYTCTYIYLHVYLYVLLRMYESKILLDA